MTNLGKGLPMRNVLRKSADQDQTFEGNLQAIADISSAFASQIIELLELRKMVREAQLRSASEP
jgi:hypothetical protein